MKKILCIYHGNCNDGFAAAWAVRAALGVEVEFHSGVYGKEPPNVTGRDVLLVDFSYKRPVLVKMALEARSIVIIDHHKTAAEDLSDFPEPVPFIEWINHRHPLNSDGNIFALFDMERSGAGLTYDFFFADIERPHFINYIEDRDLWRKKIPNSDEFTIALSSYPHDFNVWDNLVYRHEQLITEGKHIYLYYRQCVEKLKNSSYDTQIDGYPCKIVNSPPFFASDVAGELAEKTNFGVCYFEVEKNIFQYSLRSRSDFDVSQIAKKFGGGGHKAAAGFTVPILIHKNDVIKK
jgi:oligoribonuclease NrnB/cAMP/cGMP phosphodiesterase (DHH superfamily)